MPSAVARTLQILWLAMTCAGSVARVQCPVQQLLPAPDYPDTGYGQYAAIEGDTAAVFQFGYPIGTPSAMTYIYERENEVWRLRQSLLGSWSVFENESGPLAISRDWLAVGVQTYDPNGTNSHGGVHVYHRTAAGWEFSQLLTDNTLWMFAGMGCSMSFAENRLAVGTYSGRAAYVYELQPHAPNVWSLMAKLASPTGFINAFGRSVALRGTTLVVGSPGPSQGDQGAAYVFELIQGTWELVQRLQPDPHASHQTLGQVVALSGTHCLVAAPYEGQWEGIVYAFEKRGMDWQFTQELRPTDGDWMQYFGQGIALSGGDALIAAGPTASNRSGVAYHFQLHDGEWKQIGKLASAWTATTALWGSAGLDVAFSGNTALLAAPDDVLASGSVSHPQGVAFTFELGPNAVQYCTCSEDVALCGTSDSDAGCANSTGNGAMLSACGSGSVTTDDLRMESRWMPKDVLGLVLMGPRADGTPYGDGILCVGPGNKGLFRFPVGDSGQRGRIALGPGIAAHSHANFGAAGHIQAGDTWYFQAWYRDANGPCGSGFNLSNGVKVDFTQ